MANNGALKVNQHLQVDGFSNIYAVGDCANVSEPKMAYHAGLHAAVAVSNIANSLSGKELTSYQTGTHTPVGVFNSIQYLRSLLPACVSVPVWLLGNITMLLAMGRDNGVGQFNGFRLPRFLVVLGKSRDLLLWKSWREMKQKQPWNTHKSSIPLRTIIA